MKRQRQAEGLLNAKAYNKYLKRVATINKNEMNKLSFEYKSANNVAKHLNISRNFVYQLLETMN